MDANETCITCSVCGKEIPPSPHKFTSGYATFEGEKICYECCAEQDKQWMREKGRITLYLTIETMQTTAQTRLIKSAKVTNWPGSLRFENLHVRVGYHNIAGRRYNTWFVFENQIWHGVRYGDMTEIVHCKRTKRTIA